jgi:membrane protein YdbS with pleckstrin-like domain
VVQLQRIHWWIASGVIAGGSFVALLASWIANGATLVGLGWLPVWLAMIAGLAWWCTRWPDLSYRYSSYRVDDVGIEIKRGVLFRIVINVPRSRIQHTDVSQGPLERRFELGTLVIYTAGTDHAQVSLSGLEHTRALSIREHLLLREQNDAV